MQFLVLALTAAMAGAATLPNKPVIDRARITKAFKAMKPMPHGLVKAQSDVTTGYYLSSIYESVNCTGTALTTVGYAVGTCIATSSATSVEYTISSTNATWTCGSESTFLNGDCSGTATTVEGGCFPTNACFFGTSMEYVADLTDLGDGVLVGDFSDSNCATVLEFAFFPNDVCYTTGTTSSDYTCSGSTISYNTFTTADCTGTADATSFGGVCVSAGFGGLYSGYYCNGAGGASSGDDSSSCFAGSETVTLESGAVEMISNIKVGDRVLASDASGKLSFADVISVPHSQNSIAAQFSHIVMESGRDIKMTPTHLVMTCSNGLVSAGSVAAGECLKTVNGEESVVSNTKVAGNGIYTIVTTEEMVVVNGVVASPFAVNHAVANAYYNVLRAVNYVAPWFTSSEIVKNINHKFGALVTSF